MIARRKSASSCALRESMFLRTLRRAGAAFGAGRAVMLNGCSPLLPAGIAPVRYNRARPPPCMRWRGPCLATLGQVSQLPGLPDPAGRPLVPCTRDRYRFPDLCHVPRSCPREWYPFPTVKAFLLPRRVPRKGLRQSYGEIFAIHTLSTDHWRLSAVSQSYPRVYAQPFPQITGGDLENTPDMYKDAFW